MSREIVSCVGFGARALRKSDSGTPYDTYSHTLVRCRSHQSLTVRTLCLKSRPRAYRQTRENTGLFRRNARYGPNGAIAPVSPMGQPHYSREFDTAANLLAVGCRRT